MIEEFDLFSYSTPKFKIDKPIRLIELFAGIGAQAKALENLGVDFEHYRAIEWDRFAMSSYNAIHGTNFETSDIQKIHAADLGITEREILLHTYLLFPLSGFESCWKTERDVKRQRNTFRTSVGSGEDIGRVRRKSSSSPIDGKCPSGSRNEEHR